MRGKEGVRRVVWGLTHRSGPGRASNKSLQTATYGKKKEGCGRKTGDGKEGEILGQETQDLKKGEGGDLRRSLLANNTSEGGLRRKMSRWFKKIKQRQRRSLGRGRLRQWGSHQKRDSVILVSDIYLSSFERLSEGRFSGGVLIKNGGEGKKKEEEQRQNS